MSRRILVVDDESDFLQLVRYRLQDARYEFEFASGGMEALNKARLAMPDLILLDLLLPDLDGLTVCEILRRQPSTRGTPVILITAVNTEATRFAAQRAGARCFLSKPVDFAQLKSAISMALAGPPRSARAS
jgi:CheY-like chemotaxis protein